MNINTAVLIAILAGCLGFTLAVGNVYWNDYKDHENEQLNVKKAQQTNLK